MTRSEMRAQADALLQHGEIDPKRAARLIVIATVLGTGTVLTFQHNHRRKSRKARAQDSAPIRSNLRDASRIARLAHETEQAQALRESRERLANRKWYVEVTNEGRPDSTSEVA